MIKVEMGEGIQECGIRESGRVLPVNVPDKKKPE